MPDVVAEHVDVPAGPLRRVEVDRRVPRPSADVDAGAEIAAQLLRLRVQLRIRDAAVEQRHLVPARERGRGHGAAEELRPAQNEQLQPV